MHTDSEEQLLKHWKKYSGYIPHFYLTAQEIQTSLLSSVTWVLSRQSHLREDERQKIWFICLQKYFKSQLESVTLPSAYFCISKFLRYNSSVCWKVKLAKFYSKFINYKFKKIQEFFLTLLLCFLCTIQKTKLTSFLIMQKLHVRSYIPAISLERIKINAESQYSNITNLHIWNYYQYDY